MSLRLFIAIELDETTRQFMLRAADLVAAAGISGRFEQSEKLHVTLAFLGATPEERVADAVTALRSASRACAPFDLEFDSIGAFPAKKRARIIWVGPENSDAAFSVCANAVFGALAQAGWQLDRQPQPHVTICRLKAVDRHRLPRLRESTTLRVSGLTLFQSLPAGPTTRYAVVERAPFT